MLRIDRRFPWLPVLALALALPAGCVEGHPESEPVGAARQAAAPHIPWVIDVRSDGTFSPPAVNIHSGDTVEWHLHDASDSIIPINWSGAWNPAGCDAVNRKPYNGLDPNEFTGPMPDAPSGVFTLGPAKLDDDFAVYPTGTCPAGTTPIASGGGVNDLCKGAGVDFASMASTWASPDTRGVMIRLRWKDLMPTELGALDFAVLDREVDQAVANGKLYSLAIKAGDEGTPSWIFSSGVKPLDLRDYGSETGTCGTAMTLGDPTDPDYQTHYFGMLSAVAAHLKTRSDWFRALAYIKPSGANLFSHENRLPKRCQTDLGCVCNSKLFAESDHNGTGVLTNGYRPAKLYAFYYQELSRMNAEFGGKAMSYALIQDGFPRVSETGGYEIFDGTASDLSALPGPFEQTQTILDMGQAYWPTQFVVAHNGLGPGPALPGSCPTHNLHPVPLNPISFYDVPGCPNPWVLREGAQGQITGFQTETHVKVGNSTQLDATFQNAWDNTDAVYLEIYEERLWDAANNGGVLPTSGKTIGQWNQDLQTRRPAPLIYSHTFTYTGGGNQSQYHWFIHGSKCNTPNGSPFARGGVAVMP
jgi:hypothetical protein